MIDNLKEVLPLLKFESEDDFYYLQILQRKKENPQLGSNSRVIKEYYISSEEYLLNRWEEIKGICDLFNARAGIRLNKRSYRQVAFKAMQNVANVLGNESYKTLSKAYSSACGQVHNDKEKKWILDIDEDPDFDYLYNLNDFIEELGGEIITRIPSKNGSHIISTPFRLDKFRDRYPEIEVHKDNPTNVYVP